MAIYNSNIVVPTTCPLTFVDSKAKEEIYHRKYTQRFGTTDPLHVQFLSSQDLTDTFYLKCYALGYNVLLYTATFTKSTLLAGSYYYWDAYLNFADVITAKNLIRDAAMYYLDENVYFTIETSTELYMTSFPVVMESTVASVSILYGHSSNNFETVFGGNSLNDNFLIRIEGGFAPGYFKSGGDYETFKDQTKNIRLIYSMPESKFLFHMGDACGYDDLMAEKINAIMHLDTIVIGGVQYLRAGDIEDTILGNGLHNSDVLLMPYTNRLTQNIEGDVQLTTHDGTLITNESSRIITINNPIE